MRRVVVYGELSTLGLVFGMPLGYVMPEITACAPARWLPRMSYTWRVGPGLQPRFEESRLDCSACQRPIDEHTKEEVLVCTQALMARQLRVQSRPDRPDYGDARG